MRKKHKKFCTALNYIEHFLILASTIIGCISLFAFCSLIGSTIGITSCTTVLSTCAIASGIKSIK